MASLPPIANNPDIRFLGALLGDVIRAYGGDALFRRIEYIRSTSVDRARGVVGADAIDPGLERLTLDETLAFTRGFMLFSMLANPPEDRPDVATVPDGHLAPAPPRTPAAGTGAAAMITPPDPGPLAPATTA